MFQQDVEESFKEKIDACKVRRSKAIIENPDMYFSCEIEKFEVKYQKDDIKYLRRLRIDTQTAIMMINSKSKFERYDALFTVPTKDQKPTQITVSMKQEKKKKRLAFTVQINTTTVDMNIKKSGVKGMFLW